MDTTRPHLSFPAEWITATVFLAATFAVGSMIVQELRLPPRSSGSPAPAAVSAVPDDAVSVPALTLGQGVQVAVGDRASAAEGKLAAATLGSRSTELGPLGPREICSYELAGTRFIVIFEPFERRGEPRVAAIYLR